MSHAKTTSTPVAIPPPLARPPKVQRTMRVTASRPRLPIFVQASLALTVVVGGSVAATRAGTDLPVPRSGTPESPPARDTPAAVSVGNTRLPTVPDPTAHSHGPGGPGTPDPGHTFALPTHPSRTPPHRVIETVRTRTPERATGADPDPHRRPVIEADRPPEADTPYPPHHRDRSRDRHRSRCHHHRHRGDHHRETDRESHRRARDAGRRGCRTDNH